MRARARMPLLSPRARPMLQALLLQMLQRLADGHNHLRRFRRPNNRPIPRRNRNLRPVTMLFQRQNHAGLKRSTQNFLDFMQAGFNVLLDGRSNLKMPTGVFHVHGHPPDFRSSGLRAIANSGYTVWRQSGAPDGATSFGEDFQRTVQTSK